MADDRKTESTEHGPDGAARRRQECWSSRVIAFVVDNVHKVNVGFVFTDENISLIWVLARDAGPRRDPRPPLATLPPPLIPAWACVGCR